ncbi:MAG: hypothetical protein RIT43_1318, partial [Bacteroidota bacterium]
MKKNYILLIAWLILGFNTATMAQNVPDYVPANGLVGWWPFNGNANDESGNGNNGTAINGPTLVTDRYGIVNQAFNFDGSDDYVDIGNNTIFNLNDLSISLWYLQSTPI